MTYNKLEYVWIDGSTPWGIRSKVKVVDDFNPDADVAPLWCFDGSSTGQATGDDSDCLLNPVRYYPHPFVDDSVIVMCEVLAFDGTPHPTNSRASLQKILEAHRIDEPWFGFEQEYSIIHNNRPLGFPDLGFPSPQGIYYCSVGGDRSFGRDVSNTHLEACLLAGVNICGTNAEVAPGQWEFQVGGPEIDAGVACDDLWVARYLLLYTAEKGGLTVTFEPKCVPGDWNGAGCHTNFSTKRMRQSGGIQHIQDACEALALRIQEHLTGYGADIELRLTGNHETCAYGEFKWGVADRTASIRIPRQVAADGYGYLEDRRPNANCDPYLVAKLMIETVCD
jgi:glutamine synthetase